MNSWRHDPQAKVRPRQKPRPNQRQKQKPQAKASLKAKKPAAEKKPAAQVKPAAELKPEPQHDNYDDTALEESQSGLQLGGPPTVPQSPQSLLSNATTLPWQSKNEVQDTQEQAEQFMMDHDGDVADQARLSLFFAKL